MRKYLALARAEFLDSAQEKAEMFVWFLLDLLPLFIMGSLWVANKNNLGDLDTKRLVTYYFIVLVISRLTDIWFDSYIQENIRTGQFSKWLLKPLTTPFMYIADNLGSKALSISITLIPVVGLLVYIFGDYLIIPSPMVLGLFGLSLINAYLIKFSLGVFVSMGAFYWEQSRALIHARWVAENVFGGYAMPFYIYPLWLEWLPRLLPFKYIYFIPASIYSGDLTILQSVIQLGQGSVWCLALLIVSTWFWNKGLKKFSAVGG